MTRLTPGMVPAAEMLRHRALLRVPWQMLSITGNRETLAPPSPRDKHPNPTLCFSEFRCHGISGAEGCCSDRCGHGLAGDGTVHEYQEGSGWCPWASQRLSAGQGACSGDVDGPSDIYGLLSFCKSHQLLTFLHCPEAARAGIEAAVMAPAAASLCSTASLPGIPSPPPVPNLPIRQISPSLSKSAWTIRASRRHFHFSAFPRLSRVLHSSLSSTHVSVSSHS